MIKRKTAKFIRVIDDTIKLPEKSGNGILRFLVNRDEKGKLKRYSLAYINPYICSVDNGRVLGYDNSHGYHHRHYMGKIEPVDFQSFEAIAEQFEKEWRALHEKVNRHYH